MGWYYARHGQQTGPVADDELAQRVADGTVTATTLVWQPGMPEWKTYGEVSGVATAPDGDRAVCAVSGKIRPKSEMLQFEGRWVSAEHRDEFFQRLREGLPLDPANAGPVPGPYGYGGFWWRVLAKFIDGILLYVVNTMTNAVIAAVFFGSVGLAFSPDVKPGEFGVFFAYLGLTMLVNTVVSLAYTWFFLAKFQATPGKLAVGLKIVRTDGAKLSHGLIVGRFFAEWISSLPLGFGYFMAGWDEEKRALHDRICDTRVIRTRR